MKCDDIAVMEAIAENAKRQYAASAYGNFSPWTTKAGTSAKIPFDVTEYETHSGMHDTTIADSGTATGAQTSTTLKDTTKAWTVNAFIGYFVKLTGGTGSGEWREIISNTADTLTVAAWDTTPVAASTTYQITEFSTRLVAPVDGYYLITGHASINYNASVLGIFFYINGAFKTLHYTHQAQTIELNGQHSRTFFLNKDDYVEMAIYNGGGVPYSMFGGIFRLYLQISRT